ncbi:MAG: DinB family protein [Pyrinomonadaceae bacterium]
MMEITTVETFLEYFERVRERTLRVVRCIPPEKINWTYREGKFTLADLVRHLATAERYMFAENVQLRPSLYPGHGTELAGGYEEVLDYMRRLHGESMEIFRRLSDDDLRRKCVTPGGTPITVWKWLRAMVEHEIHHRGQIYLYLSMLDVPTPPLYGLTAEEDLASSVRGD